MTEKIFALALVVTSLMLVLDKYHLLEKYRNWPKRPTSNLCELCLQFWIGIVLLASYEYFVCGSFDVQFFVIALAQPALSGLFRALQGL